MSLEVDGKVIDANVNVGDGAVQIAKVSAQGGVSITSNSKPGVCAVKGKAIEAGGRVRIETRGDGRVEFGSIKCDGRVTIIIGDDDDDDSVKETPPKRMREEEEEEESSSSDDEEEEIEESESEEEEKKPDRKKKNKESPVVKETDN